MRNQLERFVTLTFIAAVGLPTAACGGAGTDVAANATSSPSDPEVTSVATPARDLDPGRARVARLFTAFAFGDMESPPVDTPVDLFLGNAYQRTITANESDDRSQWRMCAEYADHTCPMSALDALASLGGRPVIQDAVTSSCLATLANAAARAGGPHQVVLSPPEPESCADDFAVQLWINDVGQITSVNLLLGSNS